MLVTGLQAAKQTLQALPSAPHRKIPPVPPPDSTQMLNVVKQHEPNGQGVVALHVMKPASRPADDEQVPASRSQLKPPAVHEVHAAPAVPVPHCASVYDDFGTQVSPLQQPVGQLAALQVLTQAWLLHPVEHDAQNAPPLPHAEGLVPATQV